MKVLDHVAQPCCNTCQSAAIARMEGINDVASVRNKLLDIATRRGSMAGDPAVMAEYCEQRFDNYEYQSSASLNDMKEVWDSGGHIVTHGFFTGAGHVIGGSGYGWVDGSGKWHLGEPHPETGLFYMKAEDPWDEFDFASGQYLGKGALAGDDAPYSFHGIYAYCVVAWNPYQARDAYKSGRLDSNEKGAWLHCFWGDRK